MVWNQTFQRSSCWFSTWCVFYCSPADCSAPGPANPGIPTQPFQAFSSPWKAQLPEGVAPPQPHEFCIDTHRLHRLQVRGGTEPQMHKTFCSAPCGH